MKASPAPQIFMLIVPLISTSIAKPIRRCLTFLTWNSIIAYVISGMLVHFMVKYFGRIWSSIIASFYYLWNIVKYIVVARNECNFDRLMVLSIKFWFHAVFPLPQTRLSPNPVILDWLCFNFSEKKSIFRTTRTKISMKFLWKKYNPYCLCISRNATQVTFDG